MYQAYWGLCDSPFRSRFDPQYFYQSPTHEEALARLHFLIEQRHRLGLLLGPAGSGKSLLLEVFAEQLRRVGRPVAKINLVGVQPVELLYILTAELALNLDAASTPAALWRALTDRLSEYRYQQLDAAILLDDADQAGRQTLTQVTRLAQYDPSLQSRLTIVLSGRPEQMGQIGGRLLELSELRIDVVPWEEPETADFLHASLSQAGCQSPLFDEPAVTRLHELSQGIPRRVAQLAELALVAGAGRELKQIDAEVVESVYRELGAVEV